MLTGSIQKDIYVIKISESDARKKAAFTSKDASYDRERGELTFVVENATQEAFRLVWENGECFTLVEGTDKTITSTLHNIEEFKTNQSALDRSEEIIKKMDGWVSVKHSDFGAVGDGITDDTIAIQNAAVAAEGSTLFFPHSSDTYNTASKIVIPRNTDVVMDGKIKYAGSIDEVALEIGEEGEATQNKERTLILDVRKETQSNWTSESSIGIKLINLYASHVTIKRASGFTIGAQCIGAGTGFVYNTIHLGVLYGNKVGLDVVNKTTGWTIDNLFLNGQFGTAGILNPFMERVGIRITSQGSCVYTNASNLFIKPAFEIHANNASPVPVIIEHGNRNTFVACREESSAIYAMRTQNESAQNEFEITNISLAVLDEQSSHPSNIVRKRETRLLDLGTKIFDSGLLSEKACYYDGDTNIHIPGMCWMKPADATIYTHGRATIGNGKIAFAWADGGPAVLIETTESKSFILAAKVPNGGTKNSYKIRCYADNGTVLDGGSSTYLRAGDETYWNQVSWNTNHGGVYIASHYTDKTLFIGVTDHVKKICVGYVGTCDLSSFAIYNVDGCEAHVWSGYEDIIKDQNIGICPPTKGTYRQGKTILNANVTSVDSPFGWQYVASEPCGMWREI